jgi:hypothetical protein
MQVGIAAQEAGAASAQFGDLLEVADTNGFVRVSGPSNFRNFVNVAHGESTSRWMFAQPVATC